MTAVFYSCLFYLGGASVFHLVKIFDVEFFSTAGRKTPIGILHEGRAIPADAVGQGGGEFIATLPKETEVSVKDSVSMLSRRTVESWITHLRK